MAARRVAISPVAQTQFSADRADVSEGEMAYEAIKQVLEQTWLTLSDVDSAVSCSQDFWDGSILDIKYFKPLGQG